MNKEVRMLNLVKEITSYIDTLYKGNLLPEGNYNDLKDKIIRLTNLIIKSKSKKDYKKEELKKLNKEIKDLKKEKLKELNAEIKYEKNCKKEELKEELNKLNEEIKYKKEELKDLCYKYKEIKESCGNRQLIKMGLDLTGITLILYSIIWIVKLFN